MKQIELCWPCGGMWYTDGHCPVHNPAPIHEPYEVPSRPEHNAFIKKIWRICILGAFLVFITTGGTMLTLHLMGFEPEKVLTASTIVFQVVVLSYGMGFFVPAFCTSLIKMGLGVEMSRQGLEIGRETAAHIALLQGELRNLVNDAQSVLTPLQKLFGDFEGRPSEIFTKVIDFVERLEKDGTIESLTKGIKDISEKIKQVIDKEKKKAIDGEIDKL